MVQHLQQPAKATLNKHIWNILQSWNFEEHQHPPHPTDNISPPQHPATISHSILRPRPFSAPGLTLGAHHGHGASGRLDPTFQHHIITSEVKSKEERKLATEPPGSGLSATRENNNHHQARENSCKHMLAIVGALWSLEHLYSPTPRGLRTWESGVQEKPMTSWRLQGMRHKTPHGSEKTTFVLEYSCIMLRQVRVPSLSIGNTGPWILNAWDLSALTTKSSWLPRLSLGVARGGWR